MDMYLVIGTNQLDFTEHRAAVKDDGRVNYAAQSVPVQDCDIVDSVIIVTQSPVTCCFQYQLDGWRQGAVRWPGDP